MKKICYALYGLWIVSAIVLKILGLVSWFVATSWLWFPLAIVLTFLVGVNFAVGIGNRMKRKEEAKIADSCEVCLFGKTREFAEDGKCLGCTMNPDHEYGKLCSCYKRHLK